MSKVNNDILLIPGRLKYQLSTDTTLSIPIELQGDRKELIDATRTIDVDALQQSTIERNQSQKYRIGGKITQIFNNNLSGVTNYENFKNNMYLTDPISVLQNNDILFNNSGERIQDTFGVKWNGIPQYHEFNFVRTDIENPQFMFQPQSASTYNWVTYLSYVYSSSTTQVMGYRNYQLSGNPITFVVSDGIPFTIINTVVDGTKYVTFRCGGKHNLTPSQYVELSFNYGGNNLFQVSSIGEYGLDNEETSFSIVNYGFTGNTFSNGVSGTFKRIADIDNSGETKSKYYVRLHKLLTDEKGVVINKLAFENTAFAKKEKIEYSALTPNLQQRVSILDGTQSYSFTAVKDIDVSNLRTNFNKPVTSVFLTVINKGYGGWFNKPLQGTNTGTQYGWDFNFQISQMDEWWSLNNTNSFENIPLQSYSRTTQSGTYFFYYNLPLDEGHELVGDFCEYNESEQLEYLISPLNYKLTFNETLYQIESQSTSIPEGYFYQTHYEIPMRKYSSNISTELDGVNISKPYWAYYSPMDGFWKWRGLLEPGEVEEDGNGVDYPFLNGAHYPLSQFTFKLKSPFSNINTTTTVVTDPITDDCE